ncbi:hypothetical protein [Streptomyces echinatus]|uniref:Uncharacterized protein n=1 Tax=Streptomyces echinatus TaxID=67293 RepID=A0A7W9PQM8_9ACTN|nr:hypothetical protein [Streptomyces echinatus]MBB5926155.1 hypothetical protein [Streptomyces echinatus]
MATHLPLAPVREGQDWLLSCAPDPGAAQRAWDAQQLAAIPTGSHWRVAETPLARALEALRRMHLNLHGPVLGNVRSSLTWWLLPPNLADELDDVGGLTVHPAGWELHCPPVTHGYRTEAETTA